MNPTRALLVLIAVNVVWGTTYSVAKLAMETFPPPLLAALRVTLAAVLLWMVVLATPRLRSQLILAPADLRRLVLIGLTGMALSYLLGYWGLSLTTATDSALLIVSEVIFTTLLAAWLACEGISRWKGLGIVIGAVGVVILVWNSATSDGGTVPGLLRTLGDLLVMAGLLGQALYSVLGAEVARRIDPLLLLAYVFASSLLVWLPILLWFFFNGRFPSVTWEAAAGVFYLALLPSVLCNLIWIAIIRHVGASLAAISLFVQPLVGALLGLFLLGEPVTPALLLGGALIFIALYLTTVPVRTAPMPQPVERRA
jgi:drug/metabolite transporter (DMT)-like permease